MKIYNTASILQNEKFVMTIRSLKEHKLPVKPKFELSNQRTSVSKKVHSQMNDKGKKKRKEKETKLSVTKQGTPKKIRIECRQYKYNQ